MESAVLPDLISLTEKNSGKKQQQENPLQDALDSIDLDSLTPVAAFRRIAEWKELFGSRQGASKK